MTEDHVCYRRDAASDTSRYQAAPTAFQTTDVDPRRVIGAARSWLDTPYHDQASLRGVGCDCLGLARGVWREVVGPEPFPIPPYSCGFRKYRTAISLIPGQPVQ